MNFTDWCVLEKTVVRRLAHPCWMKVALTMSFLACYGIGDAFAGSIAYTQAFAYHSAGSGGEMVEDENTTDLSGAQSDADDFSFLGHASAYAQVIPRQAADPLSDPYARFRNSATAELNENRSSTGYQDGARASSFSSWSDVLHFEPISVAAAGISAWGVILDLSGSLENDVSTVLEGSIGGYSSVVFYATWGGGVGDLSHEQYGSGTQTFLHEYSPIIQSNVDPFGPEGIELYAGLTTQAVVGYGSNFITGLSGFGSAAAHFGHTGESPGLFALDAEGNILPDAANWVTVTSDSGAEYQILSEIPDVTAVPEPSTFAMLATGSLLVFVHNRRRSIRRGTATAD
ncbi:MAG: PEP-CTERM sorting domain-containing protein [Planctomycetaceae bacterium]